MLFLENQVSGKEKLSVNGFYWKKKKYLEYFSEAIQQKFNYNHIVANILASKFDNFEQIDVFLKPMIATSMPNPMHLKDMQKSVEKIYQVIKNNKNIAIFGDYDVDGAVSVALLHNYLKEINVSSIFYIPDRIKEGYGPNEKALQNFKDNEIELCILVDCGSVAYAPLSFAKKINLDVIVIDHHICCDILPEAFSVINPNRFDQVSSCGNLAAVGVVFLLLVALNSYLDSEGFFIEQKIKKPNLMKFLDLVALGTICDVMEVGGLNRSFIKKGLEIFHQSENLGIKTLMQVLNIEHKIESYHLGFLFGPRINAGGRIGQANIGAKLLTSNDIAECYDLSIQLNDLNEKRKKIEDESLRQAILQTYQNCSDQNILYGLVMVCGDWHPGVNGLITSRIKDIYNLPAVAISFYDDEKIGKASCRSIAKIDIGSALVYAKQQNLIIEGGGHKMAAGFSIERQNIEKLREFLNEMFIHKLKQGDCHNYYEFDEVLTLNQINMQFYQQLKILEPFGSGNSEPRFIIKDLSVLDPKIFGGKHISCYLKSNQNSKLRSIRAISFGNSVKNIGQILLEKPKSIDILACISFNQWQGREFLELIINDICVN